MYSLYNSGNKYALDRYADTISLLQTSAVEKSIHKYGIYCSSFCFLYNQVAVCHLIIPSKGLLSE